MISKSNIDILESLAISRVFLLSSLVACSDVSCEHYALGKQVPEEVVNGWLYFLKKKMSEHADNAAENVLDNIMEAIAESIPKKKEASSSDGQDTVSAQMNKLFGRQKPLHKVLGGGKSADVLLWRDKKISSSILTGATAVWVLFEWLNYHFLTLMCFVLVIGMLIQFVWSNATSMLSWSSEVRRIQLPDELLVNIAVAVGGQINQFLGFIQDVSCGRNLKQFLIVVVSLWAAAVVGSWCNFLTVLYIGFMSAHTLPVFYEKYEDQVDELFYNLIGLLQSQYNKLDKSLLSKIPKRTLKNE